MYDRGPLFLTVFFKIIMNHRIANNNNVKKFLFFVLIRETNIQHIVSGSTALGIEQHRVLIP